MPNLMDDMPLDPNWLDIVVRLALVTAAGALVGINREAGGHAAGFRTTILVGLAACLTMIQANLLLSTLGKTPQSFASMDVLRFPLGVLTGVGFIGGGAILKRGDLVTGVTTAATLWIMTAIGLCIGGGQLIVGSAGAVIAFIVLSPFKRFDKLIPRRQKARFVIELPRDAGGTVADMQRRWSRADMPSPFSPRRWDRRRRPRIFPTRCDGGRRAWMPAARSCLRLSGSITRSYPSRC